jgi:hypothetical protein
MTKYNVARDVLKVQVHDSSMDPLSGARMDVVKPEKIYRHGGLEYKVRNTRGQKDLDDIDNGKVDYIEVGNPDYGSNEMIVLGYRKVGEKRWH